jgi:hypothetical protein
MVQKLAWRSPSPAGEFLNRHTSVFADTPEVLDPDYPRIDHHPAARPSAANLGHGTACIPACREAMAVDVRTVAIT